MAFIYLIGERGNDNRFKIGTTKKKNIEDRLKELQTGNSEELYLRDFFETNHPFKLESSLHRRFHSKQLINEWYDLTEEDVNSFKEQCNETENMFNELMDNPFFNKNIQKDIMFQY